MFELYDSEGPVPVRRTGIVPKEERDRYKKTEPSWTDVTSGMSGREHRIILHLDADKSYSSDKEVVWSHR